MYFVDKNNKLWFYFAGSFYFITFIQKILAFIDNRTISYVSDTKKHKGKEQIVYFNRYCTAHFKYKSVNNYPSYGLNDLVSVLDIGFDTSIHFVRSKTYELITQSYSEHHIISPNLLDTGIDPEKYTILYGKSLAHKQSDLKWICSQSLFAGYEIYYTDRKNSYENTLVVYRNRYFYFHADIKSKFTFSGTTSENIDLGPGIWFHASREFITDDNKYVSLINLEEYDQIYPNIYSTIGRKNGEYFLCNKQLSTDTSGPIW